MGAGIDYGLGLANVGDFGIRYGVISPIQVLQSWADESEPFYGDPLCSFCGAELKELEDIDEEIDVESFEGKSWACQDYFCLNCCKYFDGSEIFTEPISFVYEDEEYLCEQSIDSPIMILKSPVYTLCCFCSPCYPGAGDLSSPDETGVKTFCFGHDWFELGKAPYPVFCVATNERVRSKRKRK